MIKQYLNQMETTELKEVFHTNITRSITETTLYNIVLDKLEEKEKKEISNILYKLELYLEPDYLYSTISDNLNYGVKMKSLDRVEDVRNLAETIKNLGVIPLMNKSFLYNTLNEVERLEFLKAILDRDYKKYFGTFNYHISHISQDLFEDPEEQYNMDVTKFTDCLSDVNERLKTLIQIIIDTLKYNLNMTSNLKIMEDYFVNKFGFEKESDRMFVYKNHNNESDYEVHVYTFQTENYTLR